ncbi:MAG: hypothetical protein ABUS79_17610 [Pseudomonadota bacterium]
MSRLWLALAICTLIGPRASASGGARERPPAELAGSGGIEELASDGDRLYAIRDGTVLTFDGAGSPIGRCGRLMGATARRPPHPSRLLDTADVLHDAGLPDDDSTPEAEEALDDEGGSSRRSTVRPEPAAVRAHALAATASRVWAATSDGLYRIAPEGCRRAALAGRDLVVLAATESMVVVASAGVLFQADAPDPADGGGDTWRFRPVAALAARPRALAIDATGAVLVADDGGLTRVDAVRDWTRLLDRPTRALTRCDATVAALAADGVYTWDGRQLTRAGDAPPARLLACGTGQRRWIAAGTGVWTSRDAASWTGHAAAVGAVVTALAVIGGHVWLAGDDGLTAVSLEAAVSCCALPPAIELAPPPRTPTVPPSWIWPEVGALVTVDRTATRRTVTAFLLLRFPFDRPPPSRGDRSALAVQIARRDAALARAELAAGYGATTATDIVDRDELAARREMAAEERETTR